MAEVNPRRLAMILEDLEKEVLSWVTKARDTIQDASFTLKHTEERVEQSLHHALTIKTAVENDVDVVEPRVAQQLEADLKLDIQSLLKQLVQQADEVEV